ncbi:MAG TPA: type II toxin-antitoxin system RelE/ParE family toxin [Rhizomicrobium sp.]|jgi:plasmid stabilization system protein ParE|nr:type II toxin-antitoxin system RelE/ParE family toxin [Rhizomicrobium sp.]
MTRLRINKHVVRQIDEIYSYIAHGSVQGAENVVREIYAAFDLLLIHPRAGHQALRRNTHVLALSKYPYLIQYAYFPRLDEVRIRSVRHSARRRTVQLREEPAEFRV